MTKLFCDICGKEVGVFNSREGIHVEEKTTRKAHDESQFRMIVHATIKEKSYGEICKSCFRDMVKKLLDILK